MFNNFEKEQQNLNVNVDLIFKILWLIFLKGWRVDGETENLYKWIDGYR